MVRTIKLVVSDLHVGGGDPLLDGFGQRQQAALDGLLAAASRNSGSPLGDGDDVELIVNGDGFDFQMVAPYGAGGVIAASQAMEKLLNIMSAHRPFFGALRAFLRQPGRHITFMTGNHASGSYQGGHFFHNLPWLGQVHQQKTGMNEVKGSSR